jgi:Protein of unknown function (DUF3592).
MGKEAIAVFMCLACGILLVFFGVRSWVINIKFKATSKTVDGTVLRTDTFTSRHKEGDPFAQKPFAEREVESTLHNPVVTYRIGDTEYVKNSIKSTSNVKLSPGEKVTVRYATKDPNEAYIVGWDDKEGGTLTLLLVCGIAFIAVGILLFISEFV